jgi:hypothetical protein
MTRILERIISKGKVESLPFILPGELPFSLFLLPKAENVEKTTELLPVRLQGETTDDFSPAPVGVAEWSPLLVTSLGDTPELLDNYEVYWGCGYRVDKTKI